MRKLLGCLILSLAAGSAAAEQGIAKLYVGGGVSDGSLDIVQGSYKAIGMASAVAGLQFTRAVSLQLSAGTGSDPSSDIFRDPTVSYQAVLLRLGYRWDRVGVYLLGGQARVDLDSDLNTSGAGNAFGFGINLFGNETTSLNLNVLDIDDGLLRTTTIGLQHYFGGYR